MITNDLRLKLLGDPTMIKVNQVAHSIADNNVIGTNILLNNLCTMTFLMLWTGHKLV